MQKSHRKSTAALTAALFTTWTIGAAAEQPATDPAPIVTPTDPVTTTTVPMREPMVGVGTERRTWPNRPLLITGTSVLAATYGASAIVAGATDSESNDKLFIPVVGPWMSLSDRDCDDRSCDNEALGTTLLIGSGVLQGAGALTMLLGLVIPETTTENWFSVGDEDFKITPAAGTGELGAAAIGRF